MDRYMGVDGLVTECIGGWEGRLKDEGLDGQLGDRMDR